MAKVIIKSISAEEIKLLGISFWPIWEKEISSFDYEYDETEHCFFVEGESVIESENSIYFIKAGDFVTFEKGLKCSWDIKKHIKKHYHFD